VRRVTRTGFTCTCGMRHVYPGYVFAHWDILLTITCDKCKRKWNLLAGVVTDNHDD
jgi:hypothetical protein